MAKNEEKEERALATKSPTMVTYVARDGQQIHLTVDLVKNFLVTGNKDLVTLQEFIYFMGVCRARGLNPFARDCYLIKYTATDPAAIITGIDFYRSRAKAQPDCHGWQKGVICRNKKTGELRYSKGIVLVDEDLIGGWFKSRPVGWDEPFELEVNIEGYIKKTREGTTTRFWQAANQPTMIAKVAESQGLRTLWPDEFRGTIIAEEVGLMMEAFETLDITPSQPEEGEVDTSAFDKLVAAELANLTSTEAKTRLAHLEENLKFTAKNMLRQGIKSVPHFKTYVMDYPEAAGSAFHPYTNQKGEAKGGFWKAFLDWEAKPERPWNKEPVVQEAQGAGPEGEAPEGTTGAPVEEDQVATIIFEERKKALVDNILKKLIPLADLGLTKLEEIASMNIEDVEKRVAAWKSPKK